MQRQQPAAASAMANKGVAALRQFTLGKGKSGGRNAQGRITAFHRGGGAKRLLRRIDLKRSVSGVGIVERLEYDPNRSSKIALVRWVEGAAATPPRHRRELDAAMDQELASLRQKILGSATAACDGGRFAFASLPGKVGRGRAGNVLWAALSSSAAKAAEGEGGLARLPRMAVAGSKPAFFASRVRGEDGGGEVPLGEIQEWRPDRDIWAHRIKRRAAISWQSVRRHSTLGIVGDARSGGAKPKVDRGLGAILSLAESSHQSSEHLVTGSRAPLC